jgi:predicted nucleotidyltransferase
VQIEAWILPIPPEEIADICRRYQITWMAVFGSAARRELRPESDYDFLVEFGEEANPSFFDLAHIQHELEDRLGRPVDLGTRSSIKPALRTIILSEAIPVYAQ